MKLSLVLGGILFILISPLQASESAGKTIMAKGFVSAEINQKMRNLKRRSPVFTKDIVKTGSASITQLRMIDGGLLSLNPDSQLAINKYAFNDSTHEGNVSLSLLKGGFRTITGALKKGANNYKMHTPVASIGVRGTYYEVELYKGDLYLATWDGIIDIEVLTGADKHKFSLGPTLDYKFAVIRTDGSFEFSLSLPAVFSEDFSTIPEKKQKEEKNKDETRLPETANTDATVMSPSPITTIHSPNNQKDARSNVLSHDTRAKKEGVPDNKYYFDEKKKKILVVERHYYENDIDKTVLDTRSYYDEDKKKILIIAPSYYEDNEAPPRLDDRNYYDEVAQSSHVNGLPYYEYDKDIAFVDAPSYYTTVLEEQYSQTFLANELPVSTWSLDTGLNHNAEATFSHLKEHTVVSSNGDVTDFSLSMNINFDTARISNGEISFNDNAGEWFAVMDGVINQGELDLNINFASHNNQLADGEVSGILINTRDGVLGKFSLSESSQSKATAGGTFILNNKE
jgi:hypothetical protein